MGVDNVVYVPMGIQAFVVTEDFPSSKYRFAPLIQPDYSNLRAEGLLAHDVIDQLDVSSYRLQAKHNTRFVDVTDGTVRKGRVGVYLSWTIPRAYRQGITATSKATGDHAAAQMRAGYTSEVQEPAQEACSAIKFRSIPTRYLIFRIAYPRNSSKPTSEIFVLESDRIRNIKEKELRDVDVENLTCAFIDKNLTAAQQTEAFIGLKSTLRNYEPRPNAPSRIPFTIIESANELFADYQPHNTSVFSIHDDLGFGTENEITEANLNYFIVGFHGRSGDDPLTIAEEVKSHEKPTYAQLLQSCLMEVDPAKTTTGHSREEFLDAKANSGTRIICHGTLRNVPFQRHNLNLEPEAPAVKLQDLVRQHHPIAIGTNTLDALLAYLRVQYADDATAKSETGQVLSKMVQLIVTKDSIDAQQKADDQISTNDWIPISSGNYWTIANPDGEGPNDRPVVTPSDNDSKTILELNEWETCIAALEREKKHLYQMMYQQWWYIMEVKGTGLDALQDKYKDAMQSIDDQLKGLGGALWGAVESKKKTASKISKQLKLQSVSSSPFGVRQDPTILFAGVPSGWPKGFGDAVKVRLSSQLSQTIDNNLISKEMNIPDWSQLIDKHFSEMAPFIRQILPEALGPKSPALPESAYAGEEAFNEKQGWFPLFIEWEVEYHHIKFEHWRFEQDPDQTWCYKLRTDKTLLELPGSTDCRSFSGRTPIVPQASSTLSSRIKQLFSRIKPGDKTIDLSSLADQVGLVEYFSTPLVGIRDHLQTLIHGTHARPDEEDEVMTDMYLSCDLAHLNQFSNKAPYGRLAQVRGEMITKDPFKPVTHGQFVFTKLTIVDKFGQIVSCIEPPTFEDPRSALYPCISPYFFCDPIPKSKRPNDASPWPNTAYEADTMPGLCQFFQVPPRINQEARLNAAFVIERSGNFYPAAPWDNPIWGWIIVNNLDKSLQVFDSEGYFIQEVGINPAAKSTTILSPPPSVHREKDRKTRTVHKRLDILMRNLQSLSYALGVFAMLESAYQATSSSTAEHADFLPAVFGHVFCLADFGCSIELAAPPLENQSLQYPNPPEKALLDYKFPIGLGNADAGYDGLAGYFETIEDTALQNLYSAFGEARETSEGWPNTDLNPIVRPRAHQLELSPYYISATTSKFAEAHRAQLKIRSAILDPMRSLHLYTGGLFPLKEVSLPKWAVGAAMKEMHAFFSAGPLLVPRLPPADEMRVETTDPSVSVAQQGVQMPVSGLAAWSWLQSHAVDPLSGERLEEPGWKTYPVEPVNGDLNLTASGNQSEFVEGYFIMKKSLLAAATSGASVN
ncbi:hypothetical protein F5Y14DRAFT_188260 [Nemania sp. NC0429]|nr:hypothetical protein F5Y14DRAFT_188260 [Nemania sp. NC0429]